MTDGKHTPGPWGISDGCDGQAVVGTFDDEHGPATDVCGVYTTEEDARLIAAAPDMRAVVEWAAHSPLLKDSALQDAARAALAKAEGR